MSILKSLADWEQLRRDSSKQGSIAESNEENASRSLTTDETKSQEDGRNQFERAKAHKSTMEAAVSEVGMGCLQFFLNHFTISPSFLSLLHLLQFNRKPAKGIEYLLSNKLIENKAASVAQFLKNTPSLDKVILRFYQESCCNMQYNII